MNTFAPVVSESGETAVIDLSPDLNSETRGLPLNIHIFGKENVAKWVGDDERTVNSRVYTCKEIAKSMMMAALLTGAYTFPEMAKAYNAFLAAEGIEDHALEARDE